MNLTPAMVDVMLALRHKGTIHSGRRGYPGGTLRALERRGLVRVAKVHTWETDWKFTDAGRACAEKLGKAPAGSTDSGAHIHDAACGASCTCGEFSAAQAAPSLDSRLTVHVTTQQAVIAQRVVEYMQRAAEHPAAMLPTIDGRAVTFWLHEAAVFDDFMRRVTGLLVVLDGEPEPGVLGAKVARMLNRFVERARRLALEKVPS